MEYPGYGIYPGSCDASQILQDAETLYTYLTDALGIPESSIIIYGRCIGSGPAIYLASRHKPSCLLLMSAFKSIRDIAREKTGTLLGTLISDRFRNIDLIEKVTCPTFFIHGKNDTTINYRHSKELYYKCGGPSAIITPDKMDHNDFDMIKDFVKPFNSFLTQCNISIDAKKGHTFKLPKDIFEAPPEY